MGIQAQMLFSVCYLRVVCPVCLVVLILCAIASNVQAIPLATYRERVRQSVIALDSLHTKDEEADEASHEERIASTLADVRGRLPESESVEWAGSSIQVDNAWLENALTEYEELFGSPERRTALLTETTERLQAIAEALAELENNDVNKTAAISKDESRARLSNILRRDEYSRKAAEGNALARLWQRIASWLRSLFPSAPEIEPGRAGFLSQLAQVVVIALSLAVIAFAIWKLWPRLWRKSAKSKRSAKGKARVVLGERLEPGQSSADLLAEADAMARDGYLRAAIRKAYIALLCELGDRKILGLAQHKSNRDYLQSVRNQEQLYRQMQLLTNSFENHWYGFVPASLDDWNMFRAGYKQALERQG